MQYLLPSEHYMAYSRQWHVPHFSAQQRFSPGLLLFKQNALPWTSSGVANVASPSFSFTTHAWSSSAFVRVVVQRLQVSTPSPHEYVVNNCRAILRKYAAEYWDEPLSAHVFQFANHMCYTMRRTTQETGSSYQGELLGISG